MSKDTREFWAAQFKTALPGRLAAWWTKDRQGHAAMRRLFLECDVRQLVAWTDGGYDRESVASWYGRFSQATEGVIRVLGDGTPLEQFMLQELDPQLADVNRTHWAEVRQKDPSHPAFLAPWSEDLALQLGMCFVDWVNASKKDPLVMDKMSELREEARRHNAAKRVLEQ